MVKVENTIEKQNGRIRPSKLIREKNKIIKNSLINQNSEYTLENSINVEKDTLENSINVHEDTLENSSNVQKDTLENLSNVQNTNIVQEKDNSEDLSQIDLTLRDDELENKVLEFLDYLTKKDIKVLTIDFDQTLVSVHTGGQWKSSYQHLSHAVRKFFVELITKALLKEFHVAIVTFSFQVKLINEVLCYTYGKEMGNKIKVYGWYPQFYKEIGKQGHIETCLNDINSENNISLTNKNVILIDDDNNNINIAKKNNIKTGWLNVEDRKIFL
tara:strand:- start:705 stop:1520 length:816 start_codon:yes stop_codon:yes gene_type:complete